MIKVSVIVPVYNVEKFIDKCLSSLVNQTLRDIEIIVINDGSPDNSQKIIDKYVKKYPDKVKSFTKENGGQGSARNLGLKEATGEYISFVDSDDWLDKNALEEMYNKAKEEDCDIVICDMVDHTPTGETYHNCTKYNSVFTVTPSACNKIFRREIINNIEFLNKKIWYEDFNFTTKILLKHPKISTIEKGFYHCNCGHESTMNNNNSLKNLDMITVIEDIKEYAEKIKEKDNNLIAYFIFDHILITSINRVAIQKNKSRNKVLKELTKYCHKHINNYQKFAFYKEIPRNRKIIAWLNYHYLWSVSKIILSLKKRISD